MTTGSCVLIYSGGLDSTCLLSQLISEGREVHCFHFNYGQNHFKMEFEAAVKITKKFYDVPLNSFDLPQLREWLKSNLLGDGEIPEGHYEETNMRQTVVPMRNGIFMMIAAGCALSIGARYLLLATHAGDHFIYPDCRTPFNLAMQQAIFQGSEGKVILITPFSKMKKHEVLKVGLKNEAPLDLTWTCYKNGIHHCGRCGACVERKEAFRFNGIKDPTFYLDPEYNPPAPAKTDKRCEYCDYFSQDLQQEKDTGTGQCQQTGDLKMAGDTCPNFELAPPDEDNQGWESKPGGNLS